MILHGWPVFDSLMAAVVYRDGQPHFISSVMAKELGHDSRIDSLDEVVPSRSELVEWARETFVEDGMVSSHKSGRWECLWLGEFETPIPVVPLSDREIDLLPVKRFDQLAFARAVGTGAFASHTKWLVVSDTVGPIEVAWELCELLGYEPHDHSWIPDSWRNNRVEPGFQVGFETATDAGGLPVTLRYYSFRLPNASVYLPRVWLGKRCDTSELTFRFDVTAG